jgi:hypothetical protein
VRTKDNTMDLTNWLNTPNVDIDFRENYGSKLLVGPPGGRPSFKLEPKMLCNPYGEDQVVQFRVKYDAGCMLPNWAELLLTPLGSEPVPSLPEKLPPWSADKEPEYAAALDPLIAALYRTETPLERLEAYLPLFIDQSPESRRWPTIDRVRMVYLSDAVADQNPNLVLVVFSYFSGYQIRQNGAGSGPPSG